MISTNIFYRVFPDYILFSIENAFCDEEKRLPDLMIVPNGSGDYTQRWRERLALHRAAKNSPAPSLPVWPTALAVDGKAKIKRKRDLLGPTVERMRAKAARDDVAPPMVPCLGSSFGADDLSTVVSVVCDCRRCQYNLAVRKRRREWLSLRAEDGSDSELSNERTMFIGGKPFSSFICFQ